MNTIANQWETVYSLRGEHLSAAIFDLLQEASRIIYQGDTENPFVLESVPRLADLIESRPDLHSFKQPLNALARASGLWNYIDKETADPSDLFLAEAVTSPELGGITLHREQISALNTLLDGRNLILSAPTSFGKSLLIDALIASDRYKRVAIVLPTIALLDEFRRRLIRRFRDKYTLVMHPSDAAPEGPVIFLGTQERLITRSDLGHLDLTVVDEFYKLDPNRRDDRSITLNAAVYRLLNRSAQFFFLGPNIDGVQVSGDGRWKFEFLKTRFSTVAVDTYDLREREDKKTALFDELSEENNWPALVFVSSPDKANQIAFEASENIAVSDDSSAFAEWLEANVGTNSTLARTVRFGFGLHHGRIPRAIAAHMVRLFNSGTLPVLFCTSTLIEGVNTAARSVLIFDKEINREGYDFFTYSNIKGRAGRLGRHRIGKVYLFNTPPDHEEVEVAPTLFGDEDDAPDDYIVHLERPESSPDPRIEALQVQLGLEGEDLRTAAAIGINSAAAIKEAVTSAIQKNRSLGWSGLPKWAELASVVDVVCAVKRPSDFGAYTAKQLTYFVHALRRAPTLKSFLMEYDSKFQGQAHSHDNVFKFLRACEYGLSQAIAVVGLFARKELPNADYSVFLHGLSHWFRPEELKNLDEEGIPVQISERFWRRGDSRASLLVRLAGAARSGQGLTTFEQKWLRAALEIDD